MENSRVNSTVDQFKTFVITTWFFFRFTSTPQYTTETRCIAEHKDTIPDFYTMHVENEAGPSRPRTPPTLPPRPESTSVNHQFAENGTITNETTTHEGPDEGTNADQMMVDAKGDELYYRTYRGEAEDLAGVKRLIDQELSEPYVPLYLLSLTELTI